MRANGKITHWKDAKGFGFITPSTGGATVFVHIQAFAKSGKRPSADADVSYELQRDAKGRTQAVRVRLLNASAMPDRPLLREVGAFIFAAGFLLLLVCAGVLGYLPIGVFWIYLGASSITLIAYALDKSAAKKGAWRTPEKALHGLALCCGWPGAIIAQRLLRHKSNKFSFQLIFWITVLANGGTLVWLIWRSPFSAWLGAYSA